MAILKDLEIKKELATDPELLSGIKRAILKTKRAEKPRFLKKKRPLPLAELSLLLVALEGCEKDESASDFLKDKTAIKPAPAFLLDCRQWERVFPLNDRLAIWEPNSELIFIKKDIANLSHIALHEAIHSMQGGGYDIDDPFFSEKFILLEGATESMAVKLDGSDPGLYKKERRVVEYILDQFKIKIEDVAFMNSERLYNYISREYFRSNEKDLSFYIKNIYNENVSLSY